jgi:hypothetical protein
MKQWIIKTILGEIILCGTPLTLTFICLCLVVIRSDCDLKQNKTKQKKTKTGLPWTSSTWFQPRNEVRELCNKLAWLF